MNPKISVCVPVYNNEKYLRLFLDSALTQSFSDYEIVLADNWSTDNSLDILRKYEQAFPEKIHVYQTDKHEGAGKGRNLAFQMSKGEYIYCCDSDDMISPLALEKMYDEAIKYDADLVIASAIMYELSNEKIMHKEVFHRKETREATVEEAIIEGTHFWLRLIKRELFEQFYPMPEDVIFEDIRFLTVLQSYAHKIRFLDYPVYHYFIRDTSTTFKVSRELCEDFRNALLYALKNANPAYEDVVRRMILNRTLANLDNYWQFFDFWVEFIVGFSSNYYTDSMVTSNQFLLKKLNWVNRISQNTMPNIIYVSAFKKNLSEEREKELQEHVFYKDAQVVVLDERNCDIQENDYIAASYEQGNVELAEQYFILKNIYLNGGIYIGQDIKIINYCSYLKFQNAFFCSIDGERISESIYGAPAGNSAILDLLSTYNIHLDANSKMPSFTDRVSMILSSYGIRHDGTERLYGEVISIIPPDLSVINTSFGNIKKKNSFEHVFNVDGTEENVTLPRSAINMMLKREYMRGLVKKTRRELDLEQEITQIMSSPSGKIMVKIQEFAKQPYSTPLKDIFYVMLRIRRLIKFHRL